MSGTSALWLHRSGSVALHCQDQHRSRSQCSVNSTSDLATAQQIVDCTHRKQMSALFAPSIYWHSAKLLADRWFVIVLSEKLCSKNFYQCGYTNKTHSVNTRGERLPADQKEDTKVYSEERFTSKVAKWPQTDKTRALTRIVVWDTPCLLSGIAMWPQ